MMSPKSSIFLEEEQPSELAFDYVIVVTNLPSGVPSEKQPKLQSFLSKVISSDPSADILDVYLALDQETKATLGVAIVTLVDAAKVQSVVDRVDGFEIAKGQPLKAFPFDVAESIIEDAIANSVEELSSSAKDEISVLNRSTYRDWMREEPRMEQLLTRYDDETEVYWMDPLEPVPTLYYGGDREKQGGRKWCDSNVQLSPNGSILLTFHSPGVALWGGHKFSSKTRFEHSHVTGAIFSPNEEYLLTYRSPMSADDKEVVKVWRILNGELLRSFGHTAGVLSTELNESGFLWSSCGKFLSRVVHGAVFVYETPSMRLLTDPKTNQPAPFKFHSGGVKVMSWCPSTDDETWLAIWLPEGPNEPASLQVIDVVSRKEVTAKKLFSTGDSPAEFHWHPDGDYIVLKASRLLTRSKKTGKLLVELIRMREKGFPSEAIEGFGTSVISFAWEPSQTSGRLAMVVEEEKKSAATTTSTTTPTVVSSVYKLKIYTIVSGKPVEEPSTEQTLTLANSSWNNVSWCPNGQYFVLYQGPNPSVKSGDVEISAFACDRKTATTGNPNGELGFYSCTATQGIELLKKDEHPHMNIAQWDPSGRFLLTGVVLNVHEKNSPSCYKMEQNSGYAIWTFQGRNLKRTDNIRLWNAQWRPHVANLLSVKDKKQAVKNLRERSVQYEAEDNKVKNAKRSSFMSGFRNKQTVFDDELRAIDASMQERLNERPEWTDMYSPIKAGTATTTAA